MKKILVLFMVLVAGVAYCQEPSAFRQLDGKVVEVSPNNPLPTSAAITGSVSVDMAGVEAGIASTNVLIPVESAKVYNSVATVSGKLDLLLASLTVLLKPSSAGSTVEFPLNTSTSIAITAFPGRKYVSMISSTPFRLAIGTTTVSLTSTPIENFGDFYDDTVPMGAMGIDADNTLTVYQRN